VSSRSRMAVPPNSYHAPRGILARGEAHPLREQRGQDRPRLADLTCQQAPPVRKPGDEGVAQSRVVEPARRAPAPEGGEAPPKLGPARLARAHGEAGLELAAGGDGADPPEPHGRPAPGLLDHGRRELAMRGCPRCTFSGWRVRALSVEVFVDWFGVRFGVFESGHDYRPYPSQGFWKP
jgi:hypothetical protein